MTNEKQAEFLLAEYHQLAESIALAMQNENASFRLLLTVTAGSVGAILVAATNKLSPDLVLLCAASLSSVLLLVFTLGGWLLVVSQKTLVQKLRAINAIRRYFLDLEPARANYFRMPVTDTLPTIERLTIRSSIIFALIFIDLFAFLAVVSWTLMAGGPRFMAVVAGCLFSATTHAAFFIFIRRVRRNINLETQESSQLGERPQRPTIEAAGEKKAPDPDLAAAGKRRR